MLTQKDFQKLKDTFVTKEELKMTLKAELSNYPTKTDLNNVVGELIELIQSFQRSMEERFDRFEAKFSDHDNILNNHEYRLDKVEDKVFSPS